VEQCGACAGERKVANACARVAVARFLEKACCLCWTVHLFPKLWWIYVDMEFFFLACLTRQFQIVSAHQGSMMGYVALLPSTRRPLHKKENL
jgi:hypothetical protein